MEPSDPSIIKLLDEAGKLLCSIVERDSEVGKALPVFFVSRWALCEPIVFVVHPLLKYHNVSLKSLDFLPIDIVSNLDGGSKSCNNGLELDLGTD